MPKIIENAQQMILQEARRQVSERGYSAMTMKSVAAACGLAVGTIYNYYPSKELLVASFMVEDWQDCLKRMSAQLDEASAPRELLLTVHEGLSAFIREHEALFADPGAGRSAAEGFPARHQLLRGQLAELMREPVRRLAGQAAGEQEIHARPRCGQASGEPEEALPGTEAGAGARDFLPDFLAESLLSWAGTDTEFETLCRVMTRLF